MTYFSIITPSLALFFLLIAASSASKVVEVNVLCAQTRDSSLCSDILNSFPGGTKGISLIILARYTSEVARSKVTDALHEINILIEQYSSDAKATAHYNSCLRHFSKDAGALKDIDSFDDVLRKRNYYGAFKAATALMTDLEDCLTGDRYFDKSDLPRYVDVAERVADIILTITKYLILK